jgi:hypothetical protein
VVMPRAHRRSPRSRRGFALMDVLIGGILLAVGLAAILALGGRALTMQQRGERNVVAASLLDDILSTVLTEGAKDYEKLHPMAASCDPPFEDFEYLVDIEQGGPGVPSRVIARIRHLNGEQWFAETLIADKLGEEPDPVRMPDEPVDREGRYREEEEQELNGGR